jgi:hypothetical protein
MAVYPTFFAIIGLGIMSFGALVAKMRIGEFKKKTF